MSLSTAELVPIAVCGGIAALLIVPCILCCFIDVSTPYYERSCQPTDACPKPHEVEEARVRVYFARSTSIIGACGCHPWVALKEARGTQWEIWQVIGWRLWMGLDSVVDRRTGAPDRLWYGQTPVLAGEVRGERAEEAIPLIIRAAAAEYRFASRYTLCPGPNSNTFVAHLLRSSRLGIAMPPMCIGKDYIYGCGFVQRPPSGAGVQCNEGCGMFGVTCSYAEGLRLQICMMEIGFNLCKLELYWPGIGTIRLRACCCGGGGEEPCVGPVRPWPLTDEERAAAVAGSTGWNLEDGVM